MVRRLKIFVLAPKEDWICDRIANEWKQFNSDITTENLNESDVIWLLAGWCWNQIPQQILLKKKVVLTVHHVVPEKFDNSKYQEFIFRDQFVDLYHVPNKITGEFIKNLTSKPVHICGYWYDKTKWIPTKEPWTTKDNLGIPRDKFIIGSFQRDTEGGDLKTPKLEKGPDLFCDYVEKISKEKDVMVLLGGWRRQYVISRLRDARIPYKYFELASLEKLRDMYLSCNLYVVSSRSEGGPQALLEAASLKVPIISTNVGMASEVLSKNCIINVQNQIYYPTRDDVEISYEQVQKFEIQSHKDSYLKIFNSL